MDVYLVRHAIAENRDPARWPDDAERPLTPKGIARFRAAAQGLRRIAPEVELVLASPYVRAWQTAEILADEAHWPAAERAPALEAIRAPQAAVELLQAQAKRSSLAFVGHEPHLSSLASLLLSGDEHVVSIELKKGGVILLAFAGDPAPGAAVLRWSASPAVLRSLASS
jgi:phosphohistidine phosphatase